LAPGEPQAVPAPRRRAGRSTDGLTDRELEVLAVAAEGLTNKEIGRRLFISDRTVGIHLGHAMERLGARNRPEAVQIAQRRGLLAAVTTQTSIAGGKTDELQRMTGLSARAGGKW